MTIADMAVARVKQMGIGPKGKKFPKDLYEEADQVWAVFDRDEHPKYAESIKKCDDNKVGVARSNPCFELWLILHIEEYEKPDGRAAVTKHLKSIHPEYDAKRKSANCASLVGSVGKAEKSAEKQLRHRVDEGAAFEAPSTTVGRLTVSIRLASMKSPRTQ